MREALSLKQIAFGLLDGAPHPGRLPDGSRNGTREGADRLAMSWKQALAMSRGVQNSRRRVPDRTSGFTGGLLQTAAFSETTG